MKTLEPKARVLEEESIAHADINVNDVLCGRGTKHFAQSGNQLYHSLVKHFVPDYEIATKRDEKTEISTAIVNAIHGATPPGRFLIQSERYGFWCNIGAQKAREKTSQLLRESVATRRTAKNLRQSRGSVANDVVRRNTSVSTNPMPGNVSALAPHQASLPRPPFGDTSKALRPRRHSSSLHSRFISKKCHRRLHLQAPMRIQQSACTKRATSLRNHEVSLQMQSTKNELTTRTISAQALLLLRQQDLRGASAAMPCTTNNLDDAGDASSPKKFRSRSWPTRGSCSMSQSDPCYPTVTFPINISLYKEETNGKEERSSAGGSLRIPEIPQRFQPLRSKLKVPEVPSDYTEKDISLPCNLSRPQHFFPP